MSSSILILGASYGSLLATKLLMAGHRVCLVCTRPTAEMINRDGTVVRFPVKGRSEPVVIASRELPGRLRAAAPKTSTRPITSWRCSGCRSRTTAKTACAS